MLIIGLLAIIVGTVAVQIYLQIVANKEPNGNTLIAGIADIVVGRVLYEMACINMQYDHYTWMGNLTTHEVVYYFLRYGGLIMIVLGIGVSLVCFYVQLQKSVKKSEADLTAKTNVPKPKNDVDSYPVRAMQAQGKVPAWKQVEMEKEQQ